MKKIICAILLAAIFMLTLCSCNRTIIDTKYHFEYAYISLPNGVCIEGLVKNWKDWDDSDMIQVTLDNGKVYYTHSTNVILIAAD